MILAPIDQVGWRSACAGVTAASSAGVASRNGPPDAVRMSAATAAIDSPTRHCQIAECSESIGRSQASGLAYGSAGSVGRDGRGQAARERHDEVAAGDERLLVGRRHDLAGAQRGEHRAEADDAAGADDDQVDVVARGERVEGVGAADALRAGRQVEAGQRRRRRRARRPRAGAAPPARRGVARWSRPRGRRPGTHRDARRGRRAPGVRSSRSSRGGRPGGGPLPCPARLSG